jgi:hypothetical protein
MNGREFIPKACDALSDAIKSRAVPAARSLAISPWLAASLLQKGIRRGREDLALNAAATLLKNDPSRFWRRCGVIAFEDIGLADLDAVALVTGALSGKGWRGKLGSEWSVASCLVSAMAASRKCRAADDLLMGIERHPDLKRARREFASLPTPPLLEIATGAGQLEERALALWYATGTERSENLPRRSGEPRVVFDHLVAAGFLESVVEISRQGFQSVRQILCPFLPLLYDRRVGETAEVIDDDLPPEIMIRGIPGWAFDMFVREGRQAIRLFLAQNNATARWVNAHVPAPNRVDFLGHILFAIEGGLLKSRLDWPTGVRLRTWAERESQGPWCPDATEIIELMRAELPLLNEVRAHVR